MQTNETILPKMENSYALHEKKPAAVAGLNPTSIERPGEETVQLWRAAP
jgi:hypothetical protein